MPEGGGDFMSAAAAGNRASFVHLHVHTEYSMLDGAARLKDLFTRCEQDGMPAIAMTDHGNLYGAYDFWAKATAAGIKPVIGIEAYVAPEHRKHRQPVRWGSPSQAADDISGAGAYTHMTCSPRPPRACTTCSGCPRSPPWRASSASRGWTASCWPPTPGASSPPPAARPARYRPGSSSASTSRPSTRPLATATSSARTTSSSRSWITAWTSSARSVTACRDRG